MIPKNSWIQIQQVVLDPVMRASNIPDDTKKVPLMMWTKGFLCNDANIGDQVSVITMTNRIETGILIQVNPTYLHNYGTFIEENLVISAMVKKIVFGGDKS
jgi:2-amino-4-ketopentanoate thiolase alpha subunit